MNGEVFTAICKRLETEAPEIIWIDFDDGQLNVPADQRPAVAFPACLVDIQYSDCRDTDEESQIVSASITLKLAFLKGGETNSKAPAPVRTRALEIFNILDRVHHALQGWAGEEMFSPLSRKRGSGVNRNGIKVYTITYTTTFIEK